MLCMNKVIDFLNSNSFSSRFSQSHTWIVTGVAGFIGSHIVETLLDLGQTVRGIDNFATGKKSNIEYLSSHKNAKNFTFIESDINDESRLKSVFTGGNFLVHQAALGSVPRSIEEPEATHHSNVTGFLSVLDLARSAGISRIVYASSSSVYGDSEILPKVEEQVGKVLSPYAASKMCNEVYADAYASSYNIELVGLRYFNVFGPRQDPDGPYAAVIPRWVDRLSQNLECEIFGDGETSRDFCYIDNVVLANLLSATAEEVSSKHMVFNVACGEKTTLNQLYDDIAKYTASITGKATLPVSYKDFRAGDIRHSHADISKISKELSYLPLVFRSEGIEYTVKSFLSV